MLRAQPALACRVNVDATANLVNAAADQSNPPRFVQASSIAVYGPRNLHRFSDPLTAETPVRPYDVYGGQPVEAESIVRESGLEWVILRLGGVLTVDLSLGMDPNIIYFEALLPTDGGCRPSTSATSRTPSPRRPTQMWSVAPC